MAVSDGSAYGGETGQYSLNISATPGGQEMAESENNNTRATADVVMLDTAIVGQLASEADIDYYSATITAPGVLTVNFDSPTDIPIDYFAVSVYDNAGALLARHETGEDRVFHVSVNTAGPYYDVYYTQLTLPTILRV